MNNKYDLGNFAKLLESFTPQQEMIILDNYLYGQSWAKTQIDPRLLGSDVDRSVVEIIMENSKDATAIKKASMFKSTTSEPMTTEETKMSTISGNEEESLVMPNAHIPVVLNPKFEFVPYQQQNSEAAVSIAHYSPVQQLIARTCEQNMFSSNQREALGKSFDLSKMT